jgi:hypothetical protein
MKVVICVITFIMRRFLDSFFRWRLLLLCKLVKVAKSIVHCGFVCKLRMLPSILLHRLANKLLEVSQTFIYSLVAWFVSHICRLIQSFVKNRSSIGILDSLDLTHSRPSAMTWKWSLLYLIYMYRFCIIRDYWGLVLILHVMHLEHPRAELWLRPWKSAVKTVYRHKIILYRLCFINLRSLNSHWFWVYKHWVVLPFQSALINFPFMLFR